jgi:hypothetical protein
MELIIVVVFVLVVVAFLKSDRNDSESVERKDSPHLGGDDNIKNKEK